MVLVFKHMAKKLCSLAFALTAFGISDIAVAGSVNAADEYSRRVSAAHQIQSLGDDLFGDHVNGFTGTATFQVTDVAIPGNGGLPVEFRRVYRVGYAEGALAAGVLGDWDIDIPNLHFLYAPRVGATVSTSTPTKPCSSPTTPESMRPLFANSEEEASNPGYGYEGFQGEEYWSGLKLHVPGRGDSTVALATTPIALRPNGDAGYRWVTTDNWYMRCEQDPRGFEYFLAVSPDGIRYHFNGGGIWRNWSTIGKPSMWGGRATRVNLHRGWNQIYPSKIEDRFGNFVTYDWRDNKLHAIRSSDGREIVFTYELNGFGPNQREKIRTASVGNRTWTYEYTSGGFLVSVVLPDKKSRWTLNFPSAFPVYDDRYSSGGCDPILVPYAGYNQWTYRVTHPTGAQGEFFFKLARHGRTGVYPKCDWDPRKLRDRNGSPGKTFDTVSLSQKTLRGVGLVDRTWQYQYSAPSGSYAADCGGCVGGTKQVTITDSGGSFVRETYSTDFARSEGRLLKREVGPSDTNIVSVTNFSYDTVGATPYPRSLGHVGFHYGQDPGGALVVPLRSQSTTQDGATFSLSLSGFDQRARPTRMMRSSSLGYTRSDVTEYYDRADVWLLGQVARQYNENTAVVFAKTDFHADSALPWRVFGSGSVDASSPPQVKETYLYDSLGNLSSITDAVGHRTHFRDWQRGVPQLVQFPDGSTRATTVDSEGRVKAITDQNGARTCYDYDVLGRIIKVTYPSESAVDACDAGAESAWNATTIQYDLVAESEHGIPGGHWRRTEQTGNARKLTYFDGLLRPIVEEAMDSTAISSTVSWTAKRYDGLGRLSFTSYPVSPAQVGSVSWTGDLKGVYNTFDVHGRPLTVEQDSEYGRLMTRIEYLSGFVRRTTDPRLRVTQEWFQVFDNPTFEWPVRIDSPESTRTTIVRDLFGKPISITRGPSS